MIDMGALTLFLYITARTSGFVLFNPLLGRQNIPGTFRAGFILVMSAFTYSVTGGEVPEPVGLPAFAAAVLLELAARRPATLEEFLAVPGVGTVKAQRYGKAFLDAIAQWRDGQEE